MRGIRLNILLITMINNVMLARLLLIILIRAHLPIILIRLPELNFTVWRPQQHIVLLMLRITGVLALKSRFDFFQGRPIINREHTGIAVIRIRWGIAHALKVIDLSLRRLLMHEIWISTLGTSLVIQVKLLRWMCTPLIARQLTRFLVLLTKNCMLGLGGWGI